MYLQARRPGRLRRAGPAGALDQPLLGPVDAVLASAAAQAAGADLPAVVHARPMGVAWVADQLWPRLGIAQAISVAAQDRRVDAELVTHTSD